MRRERNSVKLTVVLAAAALAVVAPGRSVAQYVVGHGIIDVGGLGPIDLDELPDDVRANIRMPGVTYDEPHERYGDVAPRLRPVDEDIAQPAVKPRRRPAKLLTVHELPEPANDRERRERDAAIARMYPPEHRRSRDDGDDAARQDAARPPARAYLDAQEAVERMEGR